MVNQEKQILIMGIGNYLMGDEGIGVHVANYIAANYQLPDNISVVDGGTGGFHLMEYFEMYKSVILIDATLDNIPGNIKLLRPKFASDFPRAMSTHDIGLRDMVCSLQLLNKIPDIHLYAVSITSIQQQGIILTAALQEVVQPLSKKVVELAYKLMASANVNALVNSAVLT